jgi:cytochrome c-type biogenesis protein CcmE
MRRRPARTLAAGAVVIAGVIGFLIYQGISNNLVYYITPSELLQKGPSADGGDFRLGGVVEQGTVHYNVRTQMLKFVLTDLKHSVRVVSHGQPPELFAPKVGCVIEGTYANGMFNATTLMIKHGSTYVAPKPGQTPVPDNYVLQQNGT